MSAYAICQTCGIWLDIHGRCPVCTKTGDYIDPRDSQEADSRDMKVIEGTTDVTGGQVHLVEGINASSSTETSILDMLRARRGLHLAGNRALLGTS